MASVARLKAAHWVTQPEHVAESQQFMSELFPSFGGARKRTPITILPSEGVVRKEAWGWYHDPFALRRTHHDVVPRECLLEEDPESPYRDGAERDVAAISNKIRRALTDRNLLDPMMQGQPVNENFVEHHLKIDVVNIVHTSYCHYEQSPPGATVFTHAMLFRRLQHLACQQNHVHLSLKICYKPPFKASHLVFPSGRFLETGASNLDVAQIMFYEGTLRYFQAAGGSRGITVRSRATQNVVATSRIPGGQGLLLPLMKARGGKVTYRPRNFAGAVIKHPTLPRIMVLAFSSGAVVLVGPDSIMQMRMAISGIIPYLMNNIDTPANRAALALFLSGSN